jgi:hypothetical protein
LVIKKVPTQRSVSIRQKRFDYNVNLEPFKGFRMQIKGNYAKATIIGILYRPQTQGGDFGILGQLERYEHFIFGRLIPYQNV